MLELIGTIATFVAVLGVYLNNHKRRCCFLLFLASNLTFLLMHLLATDIWSFCVRDSIFVGLSIHGWILWGRKT